MAEVILQKLFQPHIIEQIEKRFDQHILLSNDLKEALQFARWLEPAVESKGTQFLGEPELLERYFKIIVKCKLVALPLLPFEEIEQLLERQYTAIFLMPDYYDLWALIRVKLVALPLYEERDTWKKRTREALLRNQEWLTLDNLIQEDGQSKPPTVENWLRSYIEVVGGAPAETIKRTEYLTKNKNVQKLLPEDRKKVESLIAFFENLKLSSLAMAGLEERVPTEVGGKLMVFRDGRLEEIDPAILDIVKSLGPAGAAPPPDTDKKKILQSILSKKEFFDKVEKEKENLINTLGSDTSRVHTTLLSYLAPASPTSAQPTVENMTAMLFIAAQYDALFKVLEEPNPVREAFVKYLREEGKQEDVAAFQLAPVSSVSLGKFLRFVLVRRMRMPESDAAQVAVRIGNILRQKGKPQYFDMAYYDQATATFKWKT